MYIKLVAAGDEEAKHWRESRESLMENFEQTLSRLRVAALVESIEDDNDGSVRCQRSKLDQWFSQKTFELCRKRCIFDSDVIFQLLTNGDIYSRMRACKLTGQCTNNTIRVAVERVVPIEMEKGIATMEVEEVLGDCGRYRALPRSSYSVKPEDIWLGRVDKMLGDRVQGLDSGSR